MENQKKFDSSLIIYGWYNGSEKELTIQFPNGKKYIYYQITPEVWEELYKAESAGQYFSQHIKGKYNYKQIS